MENESKELKDLQHVRKSLLETLKEEEEKNDKYVAELDAKIEQLKKKIFGNTKDE